MMLPFMHGFRMQDHAVDLWGVLEQNWVHFFWLTGETPQTLRTLVNKIEGVFFVHLSLGRNRKLDFHNQVSNGIEIFQIHV